MKNKRFSRGWKCPLRQKLVALIEVCANGRELIGVMANVIVKLMGRKGVYAVVEVDIIGKCLARS